MGGIGVEVVGAAAEQEELEGFVGEALGGGAGLKRPVGPIGFALAGTIGDGDARVGVAAEKTDEGRSAEVHAVERFRAVDLLEKFKLEKQGFEIRTCEAPGYAANAAGKLQAAWMFGRRLKETCQAGAEVGGAADVGLGVGFSAVEGKDGGAGGKLGERGFGVGWIERQRFDEGVAGHRIQAPAMVMPSMRSVGEATEPRKTRSLPMAVTFIIISARLPAMVTSSTAWVSWPFSIMRPVAPRE